MMSGSSAIDQPQQVNLNGLNQRPLSPTSERQRSPGRPAKTGMSRPAHSGGHFQLRDYFRPTYDFRSVVDYSEDIGHRAPNLNKRSGKRQRVRRLEPALRLDNPLKYRNEDQLGEGAGGSGHAQPLSRFGRVLRPTGLLDPSHPRYGTHLPDTAMQVLRMKTSAAFPPGARTPWHIQLDDRRHLSLVTSILTPAHLGPTRVSAYSMPLGSRALGEIPWHGEIFIDYGRSNFLARLKALTRAERGYVSIRLPNGHGQATK